MAFGAVLAANLFNGLNTSAWTGWVFFAMLIGVVLIWVYTVCQPPFVEDEVADGVTRPSTM